MRKTLYTLVMALFIVAASAPARATYWQTSYYGNEANHYSAVAWFYAMRHLHFANKYNRTYWSWLYKAYTNLVTARRRAYSAYYLAPYGSRAERDAYTAYVNFKAAASNFYLAYAYRGRNGAYLTRGISQGAKGDRYMGYANKAAAGHY